MSIFVFSVLICRSSVFCILALGSGQRLLYWLGSGLGFWNWNWNSTRCGRRRNTTTTIRVSVSFSFTVLCLQLWSYIIGADFAGATGAIAPAVKILRGRRPRGH